MGTVTHEPALPSLCLRGSCRSPGHQSSGIASQQGAGLEPPLRSPWVLSWAVLGARGPQNNPVASDCRWEHNRPSQPLGVTGRRLAGPAGGGHEGPV